MKFSKLFLMSAAAVLFAAVACDKELPDDTGNEDNTGGETATPEIVVKTTEFEVSSASNRLTVEYSVTNPVEDGVLSVAVDADWLVTVVGYDAVTLVIDANDTGEDRSATVTLSYTGAEDVSFTVTQVVPVIEVETTELDVNNDSHILTVEYSVTNPVEDETLSAAVDVDWLVAVVGYDAITLVIDANDTGADRSATVTLSYPGAEDVELSVIQKFTASYEDFIGTWVVTEELYGTSATITISADEDNTGYIITGWQWSNEWSISNLGVYGIEGTTAFPAYYDSTDNSLRIPTHEYGEGTLNGDEGTFWLLGRVYMEDTGSYSIVTGDYTIAIMTLTDADNGSMVGGSVSLTSGGTYTCMQMYYIFLYKDSGGIYWTPAYGTYLPSSLVRVTSDSSSTSSVKSSERAVSVLSETNVATAL